MNQDLDKYHDYLNDKGGDSSLDDEVMNFISKAGAVKSTQSSRKDQIWKKIDLATSDEESIKQFKIQSTMAIAASLALLIIASILYFTLGSTESIELVQGTGLAEIKNILLPDGSKTTLNAESKITFSQGSERIVTLDGEAFFEVEKGDKFVVNTPYGNVEVLGTSFNEYARDGKFEVLCKTGKVKVTSTIESTEAIILPGQGVENGLIVETSIDQIDSWKVGEFYFESERLSFVLEELSRQYDINIKVTSDVQRPYTGYFLNDNLEDALSSVCLPLGLTYVIDNKNVTISEK